MAEMPQGLVCRARTRLCALPLRYVVETMRPLSVVPLAGAAEFVSGMSLIRGTPTPVVDLGVLLLPLEPGMTTRFVTLRLGQRTVALAVEDVLAVRDLPETLASLPPLLGDASAVSVSALGRLDEELLLVLEATRLVPDSVWAALDLEGGA
jgi:purine-binding chemotaxis protein CheW